MHSFACRSKESRSKMPREDPVKFMMKNMLKRVPLVEQERLGLVPSRSDATILFSRYPDGTLRLYKPGSILDDAPAGYSEENVVVKALVKRESEEFMVTIPITRTQLDNPTTEAFLHETAYSHRHERSSDKSNRQENAKSNLMGIPSKVSKATEPAGTGRTIRCLVEKGDKKFVVKAVGTKHDDKTDAVTFPSYLYEGEGFTLVRMEGEPEFEELVKDIERTDYESSKASTTESGTSRSSLCEGSADLSTSPSDSNARSGERSPDALGTNERGEDSAS